MISLALIGHKIQHSLSSSLYKDILGEVDYHLYDVFDPKTLDLKELLKKHSGISITAPHKRFFLDQVDVLPEIQRLNSINCLRMNNHRIQGGNTDYLAVKKQLEEFKNSFSNLQIYLLGDGAMSFMTQILLSDMKLNFEVFSRKQGNLNFDFSKLPLHGKNIIINTCSRDFIFNQKISSDTIFWDFNYSFSEHDLLSKSCDYIDGFKMLKDQAIYALDFWKIT